MPFYMFMRSIIPVRNLFIIIIVLCFLAGCEKSHPPTPKGIVVLTPSLAEAVDAFRDTGALDDNPIVAVSKYATQPQFNGLPKLDSAGSLETIASLHPSIVFAHSADLALAENLTKLGIKVVAHDMDTLEDIRVTVRDIGEKLNQRAAAQRIIERMNQTISGNRARFRAEQPPKALIIVDALDARMQQLYIAQKPAYLVALFEGCGLDIIPIGHDAWQRISAETLIRANPAVIVYLARSPQDADDIRQNFKKVYPDLQAIRNNMLYIYTDPDITVPGPDIGQRQTKLCEDLKSFLGNRNP